MSFVQSLRIEYVVPLTNSTGVRPSCREGRNSVDQHHDSVYSRAGVGLQKRLHKYLTWEAGVYRVVPIMGRMPRGK